MKFFSDIKPIIKLDDGGDSSTFIPKDKFAGKKLGVEVTTTPTSLMTTAPVIKTPSNQAKTPTTTEELKVKIYQHPKHAGWINSIDNPNESELLKAGWTVVNSMPRGEYDAKGMGGYDAKDKFKGDPTFQVLDPGWGDKKDTDKKGLTFSDLRALNATAANKIERVPQGMPVAQMTRVDPLGRSQAIDKQKQDAQANANAARMRGPQNADPTLNVLQNLSTTAQVNEQTAKANMMQGENLSNQRDRQRSQVENANLIETNNQNVRIGLRNAQEREMAQKKTQQRVTNAQIGNTWLGEKETEQKNDILSDAQLVERYAALAITKDPRYIANSKARADLTPRHLEAESNLKSAQYNLAVINSKLNGLEPDDPSYKQLADQKLLAEGEVKTFQTTFNPLKTEYEKLKADTKALQDDYERKLIEYQREVNKGSNTFGGANTDKTFKNVLEPFFNSTTPVKKKGGSLTMEDRLYLENIRHNNKAELQRNKQIMSSFVLPEPKAYYITMRLMEAQNKATTDMAKEIYKSIMGRK